MYFLMTYAMLLNSFEEFPAFGNTMMQIPYLA
jgi:hypothetical protein